MVYMALGLMVLLELVVGAGKGLYGNTNIMNG